jgi:GxxExxY protein
LKSTTDYTDDTDQQMIHEDLSGKIIGAAIQVLNELKPGLDEKLYERAIAIELKRRGHILSVQRSFPVYYGDELIGNLVPDLIVNDAVIVDPKVVACFTETHVAQMIGYLNITGLDLALLINFKNARLECATRMEAGIAPYRDGGTFVSRSPCLTSSYP